MYIKIKDLRKTNENCTIKRNTNNSFIETNSILNINCLISYNSNVALKYQNILIVDQYYINYSKTTNDFIISKLYSNDLLIVVNGKLFDKLFDMYKSNNMNIFHLIYMLIQKQLLNIKTIKLIKSVKPQNIDNLKTLLKNNNIPLNIDIETYNKYPQKEYKTVTKIYKKIIINKDIVLSNELTFTKDLKTLKGSKIRFYEFNNYNSFNSKYDYIDLRKIYIH